MNNFEYISDPIQDVNVDCIVNSVNPSSPVNGRICEAIFKAGGKSFENKVVNKLLDCIYGDVFAIKSQGDIKAKYVINVCIPFRKDDYTCVQLHHCLLNVFKEAEKTGANTIAIPFIGTGANGYYAGDIVEAVNNVSSRYPDIKVYVCSKNYKNAYEDDFKRMLKNNCVSEIVQQTAEDLNIRRERAAYVCIAHEGISSGYDYIKEYIRKTKHPVNLDEAYEDYKLKFIDYALETGLINSKSFAKKVANGEKNYTIESCFVAACVLEMPKRNFKDLCQVFGHAVNIWNETEEARRLTYMLLLFRYDLVNTKEESSDFIEELLGDL